MSRVATMHRRLVARNLRARPRVMVSGCFDLLHSGHVAFLQQAAALGHLHVAIGSDKTILKLKGKPPVNDELERLYMVRSLRCVHEACISGGTGSFDFAAELSRIAPDLFFVNDDGDSPAKRALIEQAGVRYILSRREPATGLPVRSTTSLRDCQAMPFRLDLAGGWLDQPFVSRHHAGPVINCCIEPAGDFQTRSGLASSTRAAAMRLWGPRLPAGDRQSLARTLFACENPPGTTDVSGSQDAIGVVFPGVNRLDYAGEYWPAKITTTLEPRVIEFLESHVQLLAAHPRADTVNVLTGACVTTDAARRIADAADKCWQAIQACNASAFAEAVTQSFDAQVAMFPNMINADIARLIGDHQDRSLGHKIAGAGGGGYVVLVSPKLIPGARPIRIRRDSEACS